HLVTRGRCTRPGLSEELVMVAWKCRSFSPGDVLVFGVLGLVGLGVARGVCDPPRAAAQAPGTPAPAAAPQAGNPMDEPLRLLARARQANAAVRDYTCTLIKQERIGGQLQPVNVVTMMVRNEPFSIYLKWHQPKAQVGQEACYV